MKKSLIAGLALAAVLGLSACGATVAPADKPSGSPAPVAQTSDAATPAPAKAKTATYGQQFIWDDGLAMTVNPTGAKMASETAAGATETNGEIYTFDVTITNNTKETFDPALFGADVNYGADGKAAQRVFDSGAGIGDNFQGKILVGKKQTVTMAYAIPKTELADVQMVVTPSFLYTTQIFTGGLK